MSLRWRRSNPTVTQEWWKEKGESTPRLPPPPTDTHRWTFILTELALKRHIDHRETLKSLHFTAFITCSFFKLKILNKVLF